MEKCCKKCYISIDLKSFYASVECRERGLDPLNTNLVVADESRTEKTICLAVSPPLKARGVPGRPRLFEVIQKVKYINQDRAFRSPKRRLEGESCFDSELKKHPEMAVSYIVAPPRMALYMKYSTDIYKIYLKYIAPEDMHIYSVDEAFIDATSYLYTYGMSARELAEMIIKDVLKETGITATVGIGTNLYLSKVAMDIMAKKMPPDRDGVRIAELDEMSYRRELWDHEPITDFWRVGHGYDEKLRKYGIYTMGDIARCSLGDRDDSLNEDLLYRLFGVNAELLIDHAWGWEPCEISDIKSYRPTVNSLSSGQVLTEPYTAEKARLVTREMAELLTLELADKSLDTAQLTLTVSYDAENLKNPKFASSYTGQTVIDIYGRRLPKHAHGTVNLKRRSASVREITAAISGLYDEIVDFRMLIRKINITACGVEASCDDHEKEPVQLSLFADANADEERYMREMSMERAILGLKRRYGKNAVLRGMNFCDGATAMQRNRQIGGHHE